MHRRAGLEAEWLPSALGQVKNPRIQKGQPGHFVAADHVELLGGATPGDRLPSASHPGGTPHIQLDPHNIVRVADALTNRFVDLDPGQAGDYHFRHTAFIARWQVATERWEAEAKGLRGTPWVVHDTSWVYLERWLGLVRVATLAPKPGVAPTPARLAKLLDGLQTRPAKLVVRGPPRRSGAGGVARRAGRNPGGGPAHHHRRHAGGPRTLHPLRRHSRPPLGDPVATAHLEPRLTWSH